MPDQNNDALETLNRRLASGEITPEHYAKISETINKQRNEDAAKTSGKMKKDGALWFIIPSFSVLFIIYSLWFNMPEGERGMMSDGAFIIVIISFLALCFGLTKLLFGR